MKDKGIKFSVLAQEAIDWYVNHDRRDVRNFKGRMKFIVEAFADRVADEIKPSDIDISRRGREIARSNQEKVPEAHAGIRCSTEHRHAKE